MVIKITKVNALNETLEIEEKCKPEEWEDKVRPILKELDRRQFELNLRVLTVNKEVGKLSPENFMILRDILAGLNNILIEPTSDQMETLSANSPTNRPLS